MQDSACFCLILPFPARLGKPDSLRFVHTLFVSLPTCVLRELLASTTAVIEIRPRHSTRFALYWRQDTRSLKPASFLKFLWAPSPPSPERHYSAAFFALWLAFAKLIRWIHAKKAFQPWCALPRCSLSCSHVRGSFPLTPALLRLVGTLLFSHSAAVLRTLC